MALCQKSALEEYLRRAEPLRNVKGLYSSKVFRLLSPIERLPLQLWLNGLKLLELSGVGTTIFKTHSVRGTSATALYSKGANLSNLANGPLVQGKALS